MNELVILNIQVLMSYYYLMHQDSNMSCFFLCFTIVLIEKRFSCFEKSFFIRESNSHEKLIDAIESFECLYMNKNVILMSEYNSLYRLNLRLHEIVDHFISVNYIHL